MVRRLALLTLALGALAACGPAAQKKTTTPPADGSDAFTSAAPGNSGGATASAGGASAGAADGASGGSGTPRTVEEGDVYKVVGDELYVLNTYRGLQIIDVSNPDRPVKQGTSPIFGYPVEMYVRDGFAYVVVSDYFTYWQVDGDTNPFHGSEVRIVDVRDPAHPTVVGGIDLDGAVSDTRIVGDVLYVVANRWAWYENPGSSDNTDALVVSSIDLANPASPQLKEQLSFAGSSNVIHVSPTTLYVASPNNADWQNPTTDVTVVDINDPHGHLATTGNFSVSGSVQNRFQLDENAATGTFRIVTHTGSWGSDGAQSLVVFSLAPQLTKLSELDLSDTGGLSATRFDNDRCYIVTEVENDPFDVVDLRDPAHPQLAHSVVLPGLIQQISPLGDRLLALGTDDRWQGVAASLFDVADPQHPALLSRVRVGTDTAWSNANWDDKALSVLDDQGLMLVPFSGYASNGTDPYANYVNGFQLVSFDRAALTAQGTVTQTGEVSRLFTHANRILSLSDRALQAVDATDRAHPTVTAALELARDVSDFAIVGGHAVTLTTSGWWWQTNDTELRVADLASPEDGVVGKVALPFRATKMLADGTGVIVLGYPTNWDGSLLAARVELANPAQPLLQGNPVSIAAGGTDNLWTYPDAAILAAPGVAALPAWGSRQVDSQTWQSISAIQVVDLAHASVARLDLPGPMSGDLLVSEGSVWTTHEEDRNGPGNQPVARFYADRLDVSDPAHPAIAAKLNIPGSLVGTAEQGTVLFTRDYQWMADGHLQFALAELDVQGAHAHLRAYLKLDEGLGRILVDGRRLYATTEPWWWTNPTSPGMTLRTYASDATTPLHEVSSTSVGNWLELRAEAGGHLFLGSGYWGGPWELADVGGGAMAGAGGAAGGAVSGVGGVGGDVAYFGPTDGLLDYALTNPDHPEFKQFIRTNGWVQGLAANGSTLYVSGGIYGIEQATLTP